MKIYFIGMGGTAMGSVAIACAARGYVVVGSDEKLYEPMSSHLLSEGLAVFTPFSTSNVENNLADLYIIGNAVTRGNPEVEYILNHRLAYTSLAAFVGEHFIDRNSSVVVTGTHGKTTVASMITHILSKCGFHPGYLIGGVLPGGERGCRQVPDTVHNTHTGVMVVEGDEYDTAFFDKRSKFLHYRPTHLVVNNIEYDHADIFGSLEDIRKSFLQVVRLVPETGVIVYNTDDALAAEVAATGFGKMIGVGSAPDADITINEIAYNNDGTSWNLANEAIDVEMRHSLFGRHNVLNASIAVATCYSMGCSISEIREAVASFILPRRRLEYIGEWNSRLLIDDFAHHPTAVAASIEALRSRYPQKRISIIFEPRSNTSTRSIFQREYATALRNADAIAIGPINRPERYAEHDRLDVQRLALEIQSGKDIPVFCVERQAEESGSWGSLVIPWLSEFTAPGDVIAIFSNGNAGNLRDILTGKQLSV